MLILTDNLFFSGHTNRDPVDHSVMYVLPQPTAQSKRYLICVSMTRNW